MKVATEQRTWVVIETINEGENGEKVTLRRIPLVSADSVHASTMNELVAEAHQSYGDYPEGIDAR
jgi:hypothetical protein